MTGQTGPGTAARCRTLLSAATKQVATPDHVAALFTDEPGAHVDLAVDQLSLAGLLAG